MLKRVEKKGEKLKKNDVDSVMWDVHPTRAIAEAAL